MPKAISSKKPQPSATPTLNEYQKAARTNVAERSPSDLSTEEVQRIRAYRASGARCISIATELRIGRREVSKICKFQLRADVPRPFETDNGRLWRETIHRQNETAAKMRFDALAEKESRKKEEAEKRKAEKEKKASRNAGPVSSC